MSPMPGMSLSMQSWSGVEINVLNFLVVALDNNIGVCVCWVCNNNLECGVMGLVFFLHTL